MHMPSSIGLRGVLLAAMGTAIGLAALGWFVFILRDTTVHPEYSLPADQTAALVYDANEEQLTTLRALFPTLALPPLEGPMHVAVIRQADGTHGWALFPIDARTPLPDTIGTAVRLPGNIVARTSTETVATVFSNVRRSLGERDGFRALADTTNDAWTYVAVAETSPLGALVQPVRDIALLRDDADHLLVYVPDAIAGPSPIIPRHLETTLESPAWVAHSADGAWLWRALLQRAGADNIALNALARTWTMQTFGADANLSADLLPLLDGDTTMHMDQLRGEKRSFGLLALMMHDTDRTRLDHLHASKAQTETPFRILDRMLDVEHGFQLRAIAPLPPPASTEPQATDPWHIRTTGDLTTAQGEARLVMGNDGTLTDVLLRRGSGATVHHAWTLPALGNATTIVAGGYLSPTTADGLKELAHTLAPGMLPILLPDLHDDGSVLWSVNRKGAVWSVSVQNIK